LALSTPTKKGFWNSYTQEIAADDMSIEFCHRGIKSRVGQSLRHTRHRDLGRRIAGGKVVLHSYGLEGFIADRTAHCGVFRRARTEYEWHGTLSS
jgi:hypothetical protein